MAKDGSGKVGRQARTPAARKPRSSAPASFAGETRASIGSGNNKTKSPPLRDGRNTPWQEFQIIFGENIRAARLKAGLKQSEASAMTGLTQQYLSLIEAGQQNVTLKTMSLLAGIYDKDMLKMLKRPGRRPKR